MILCSKKTYRAMLFVITALLLSSCASLSPNGVGRIKHYGFADEAVPEEFNGYKIAFISDIHYPSLFNRKRLEKLTGRLRKESPDLLLLGGDNVTSEIYKCVLELLSSGWKGEPLRLIGIRLGDFTEDNNKQLSLFDTKKDYTSDKIQKVIDNISEKYGDGMIIPASLKQK